MTAVTFNSDAFPCLSFLLLHSVMPPQVERRRNPQLFPGFREEIRGQVPLRRKMEVYFNVLCVGTTNPIFQEMSSPFIFTIKHCDWRQGDLKFYWKGRKSKVIRRLLTTDFYSASALDLETVSCFFGHQELEFLPRKTPVDRRSSDEPARSIPSELKTIRMLPLSCR